MTGPKRAIQYFKHSAALAASLLCLGVSVSLSACGRGDSLAGDDKTASPPAEPIVRAGSTDSSSGPERSTESLPRPEPEIEQAIEKMARDADNTVIDGWFFGQEARMLKSFYRKVDAVDKARFAVAYHKWIMSKNQDMVRDFESYVPYSQRVAFARQWWSKDNPRFLKQEIKYQVLWMHESIEDAGELWWRAVEKLREKPVSSLEVIAHDEEQKMVSKFMESSRSPHGSISEQIWKASHADKAPAN